MRPTPALLLLPLLLATGSSLSAQKAHIGFSLNLNLPTGAFASTTYPPYYSSSAGRVIPQQTESYDLGLGGSFTVSFPMDRNLAIRLNLGGQSEYGSNRAPGEATINLRHSMFNMGGDLQIFPGGTAFRHRGFYFVGGLSADFETFDRTFGSFNDYYYDYSSSYVDSTHKSRLGGNLGFGHSFGGDAGMRFTLEATYHATLTAHDTSAGDPPSTDFVKLAFGFVF
jgi:hypothetical protein